MSDKEYKLRQFSNRSLYYSFPDGGYHDEISSVLRRVENDLNQLYDENQSQKQEIEGLKQALIRCAFDGDVE